MINNRNEVVSIISSMMRGTRFVEISTYLKNHTTLEGHALNVVRDNLSSIQRKIKEIEVIAEETLDFC